MEGPCCRAGVTLPGRGAALRLKKELHWAGTGQAVRGHERFNPRKTGFSSTGSLDQKEQKIKKKIIKQKGCQRISSNIHNGDS